MILTSFTLYQTPTKWYIVGHNTEETEFRVLKLSKQDAGDLQVDLEEDTFEYSREQVESLLEMIKSMGNPVKSIPFLGIVGFIRFLNCHYLVIVTKRSAVAIIGGHIVYRIEQKEILPLGLITQRLEEESRYLNMFQQIDLKRNFYFSYAYDITKSLQRNLCDLDETPQDMFVWNSAMLTSLVSLKNRFHVNLINGFVDQGKIQILSHSVLLTLIARRSRHYQGSRFLKRGINDKGYVANEVETEQIVHTWTLENATSFVQHRGSIPLAWSQDTGFSAKPAISLDFVDPFHVNAAKHFDMLFQRYGTVTVLNLVKFKEPVPREAIPGTEYKHAIDYLNQGLKEKIRYIAWDMAKSAKKETVIPRLESIAEQTFADVGLFQEGVSLQSGVVRTNCIDCLDRTNAAQFILGKRALAQQFYRLGLIETPKLDFDTDAVNLFTSLFQDHGDTLSLSYGGSGLVNSLDSYRRVAGITGQSRDFFESIKRFYSNSFTDAEKQQATNLFLQVFKPSESDVPLWELESDWMLHNETIDTWLQRSKPCYREWMHLPEHEASQTVKPTFPFLEYYRKGYSQFQSMLAYQLPSTAKKNTGNVSPFFLDSNEKSEASDEETISKASTPELKEKEVSNQSAVYSRWLSLANVHQATIKPNFVHVSVQPLSSSKFYASYANLQLSTGHLALYKQYLNEI